MLDECNDCLEYLVFLEGDCPEGSVPDKRYGTLYISASHMS